MSKKKTTLKFSTHPDTLPGGEGRHFGKVIPNGTATQDDVIDQMIADGCRLGRLEIKRILNAIGLFLIDQLRENPCVIDLGFCRLRPVIKGSFAHEDEPFDPKRHKLVIEAIPSPSIAKAVKDGFKLVNVMPSEVRPTIESVCYAPDFKRNTISASGEFEIHGTGLTVERGGESAVLELPSGGTLEVRLEKQTAGDGARRVKAQLATSVPSSVKRARLVFLTHGLADADSPLYEVRSAWLKVCP